MCKRNIVVFAWFLAALNVNAQICTTSHQKDLFCLLPAAFHIAPGSIGAFSPFTAPFGTQLAQLPLATPSGFVLGPTSSGYKPIQQSFGPVFAERADTIGTHRLYLGFTYQRFRFDSIDGTKLGRLPILLICQNQPGCPNQTAYTATQNRFDIKADQYAAFAVFGLTDRVDLSVAVPFERVGLGVSVAGTEYLVGSTATQSFQFHLPGSASSIGDVTVGIKGTVVNGEKFRLAVGTLLRLPTGDELNFLGSGTVGVQPFVVLSRAGRFAPHLNLGYQWNGDSILNAKGTNSAANPIAKQQLPTDFSYKVGADLAMTTRFTFVVDLLGQQYFDAPRFTSVTNIPVPALGRSFPTVQPTTGGYTVNNLGIGGKVNIVDRLLATGNLLIKLDHGGLRSDVVPLIGLSYTF